MANYIITGLDIGSNFIRIAIAQPLEKKLQIIGYAEVPSEGISKGIIISIEDCVASISSCLEKAERMIGMSIESVFVGISGYHINSQESRGVIAVSRADGEINVQDVERVLDASQTVATPPNFEILHVIPRSFIVDNQIGIKDPLGMSGVRLEVEAQIILGLASQIKNLTKAIYRTGLDIDDLVFSILATAEAVLTKRQKELGVAVISVGGSTTSIGVYEEGDVILAKVLPIGSNHITNDIAIGLRTSIDVAEKVKLNYGSCLPSEISKKEEINLAEIDEKETARVSKKNVAEIIEARVEEIFKLCDKEFDLIRRSGKLPGGVILTGGGAKLYGIQKMAKNIFKLPAGLGTLQNITSAIDKVNDPSFSCAVGLLCWGMQMGEFKKAPIRGVVGKIKKLFKGLIP